MVNTYMDKELSIQQPSATYAQYRCILECERLKMYATYILHIDYKGIERK